MQLVFLGSEGGLSSLFTALGLNVQALVLNALAFLVIVAVLAKWVYPPLVKALDGKIAELETATRLEKEAKQKLEEAAAEAEKLLSEARKAADEVTGTAREEAMALVTTARDKAKAQGERLMVESREQLARDVETARAQLKADAAKLAVAAAETILAEKLDDKRDGALIERSLKAGRS